MNIQEMILELLDSGMGKVELAYRMGVEPITIGRWAKDGLKRENRFMRAHLERIYKRRLDK